MSLELIVDDRRIAAVIAARRPSLQIRADGRLYDVVEVATSGPPGRFAFSLNGQRIEGWRYVSPDAAYVRIAGRTHVVRRPSGATRPQAGQADCSQVVAAFPGVVVAVHCREGDEVRAGDRLLTTESMKLQVTHLAPRDGRVASIFVAADASFDKGTLLVALVTAATS
jgi:acetyl/propionyl-CoA carboxylase alpha subunit